MSDCSTAGPDDIVLLGRLVRSETTRSLADRPAEAHAMVLSPLPLVMIEPVVRAALLEDLGRAGDLTTDALVPADLTATTALVARQPGVVAGLDFALTAFRMIDPAIAVEVERPDGTRLAPGDTIAVVRGSARGILTAERTALNFLCHLSGVASATRGIADAIRHTKARVCCTRKTMPGLRAAQKYAVRVGGGLNHRFGLDDAVLIKDNHVAIAGGVRPAVERARAGVGHLVKIELEVDTLAQLAEALTLGVDAVLLDNMTPETLREAVAMVGGRAITEASGRIRLDTAPAIAETGVDLLSAGWLTHSATALDIGLDHRG
jgi:nicotinate-nucleotide pyrophosphorylase (carboxylating)